MRIALALALALIGSAAAASNGVDLVEHNGSVVQWTVAGDHVVATYEAPRPGIAAAGVRPGTILFEGDYKGPPTGSPGGEELIGTAYAYKAGCAPVPYTVHGYERRNAIVLEGPGPHRDPNSCRILGYSARSPHAILTFRRTGR